MPVLMILSQNEAWMGLTNPGGVPCADHTDCSSQLKWADNSSFEGKDWMANEGLKGIENHQLYYMHFSSRSIQAHTVDPPVSKVMICQIEPGHCSRGKVEFGHSFGSLLSYVGLSKWRALI